MSAPLQQFLSVALPIIVALWIASWSQNKRFDDMRADIAARFAEVNRRIDEVVARLDRIERKLDNHDERLVRLETRSSLVR